MRPLLKMSSGIVELDLHGKNVYQARVAIDALLRRSNGVVRLRLIHGSSRGTALREMIWDEYAQHPKVKRLLRIPEDVPDLVLREL